MFVSNFNSLKQEFEIKIKLLEDRLNTLTLEKEKQEKIFKEKLENIEKEHKVEIERLKGLHKYSKLFYFTCVIQADF